MALSVHTDEKPRMSTGTNIIICTTTTTNVFKFRFHCRVTYYIDGETATKQSIFVQPKNSNGVGVFNMMEIYRSVVTPMIRTHSLQNHKGTSIPADIWPIHNLPLNQYTDYYLFSRPFLSDSSGWLSFQGQCNKIELRFNEMYSTTAGGVPTIQGSPVDKKNYVFYGRGERNDYPGTNVLDGYQLTGTDKLFLTNNYKTGNFGNKIGFIGRNQRMTMTFRNGHDSGAAPTDTKYIRFIYYNSAGTILGFLVAENEDDSGGKYGGVTGAGNDERSFFLIVGTGLKNLDELDTSMDPYSGVTPADAESNMNDTIAYYTIFAEDSSFNRISQVYRMNVTQPCGRYEETRLAYLNKFGCWEYINLNKERKEFLKVKRDTINKPIIHGEVPPLSVASGTQFNTYPENMPNQGVMVTNVKVEEELSLFTQNLDNNDLLRIQDLIMSPQIHMCVNDENGENTDEWVALICKTNKIDIKEKGVPRLYNYNLKFTFADPKYRTF